MIILILFIIILVFFIWSACMVSNYCSKFEERENDIDGKK